MKKIPIGTVRITPKARRYVNQAISRNRLTYGPFSRRFETRFARLHGVRHAILTASGTCALQVALQALQEIHRWPEGSEVLVPATTFISTPNAVLHNRLRPVFVDIDPVDYSIAPDRIVPKITRKTRAILPVHLFGQPADMGAVMAIARRRRLRVVEDSAETMLSRHRGRSVGSFGDIGCFSTYAAHLLTTGVGGIMTTDDTHLATILRSLINHGRDALYLNIDDDAMGSGKRLHRIVKKRFSFVRLGHSFRLTEMEAAIGLAELGALRKNIARRRENARFLTRLLEPLAGRIQLPATRPENDHAFMVYPIILKREEKSRCVRYLESRGIETRDLVPLLNQPVYRRRFRFRPAEYPVSRWLVRSGFYVGCHQGLTRPDIEYLASVILRFFARR